MLADEAALVRRRRNGIMVSEATLIQTAVSALLSKKGGSAFKRLTKKLQEG